MKFLDILSIILLIVGGVNWGLIGLFDFNAVAAIFGNDSILSNIIYTLVGLSALYQAAEFRRMPEHGTFKNSRYQEVPQH